MKLVIASLVLSSIAYAGSVKGTVIFEGEAPEDASVVVTHGKLRDAVVRIKGLPAGAAPDGEAHLDKHGSALVPRVLAIHAGQKVKLGDACMKASKDPATAQAGDVIDVTCKALHGYITVEDSWHFAVTGEDGKFEIDDLEPGTYTLEAWHPTLGTRSVQIVIGKAKRGDVTARLSYKP